jgi:hypothetical protein
MWWCHSGEETVEKEKNFFFIGRRSRPIRFCVTLKCAQLRSFLLSKREKEKKKKEMKRTRK